MFIDLVDSNNQKLYFENLPSGLELENSYLSNIPCDTLCYGVKYIENIIMSSASFNGVRNILTGRVNHLLEPNAELKINAIRSFFESYE